MNMCDIFRASLFGEFVVDTKLLLWRVFGKTERGGCTCHFLTSAGGSHFVNCKHYILSRI